MADQLKGQVRDGLRGAEGRRARPPRRRRAGARRRDDEGRRRPARRGGAAGARALRHARCPRRARASCCAASIQALCEGRDPGDLTTIEDPSALQQISDMVAVR
ncbi:MAG: hypothetical protein MZW92_54850 [Comamonadaceae bacterium]|nr:hypothetical protein [Comamonadaceae bacterium]